MAARRSAPAFGGIKQFNAPIRPEIFKEISKKIEEEKAKERQAAIEYQNKLDEQLASSFLEAIDKTEKMDKLRTDIRKMEQQYGVNSEHADDTPLVLLYKKNKLSKLEGR